MNPKQNIIETIKRRIEESYKDDVAIFAVYGSYAMGTDDAMSDVDFFFIPKTEGAMALSYQFIIDGIGYDLFPIKWERLLKIAAFDSPLAAVITESKVVYSASKEDLERYEGLRSNMLRLCSPEGAQLMLNKSYEFFNETYIYWYNMTHQAKGMLDLRIEASKVISKVVMAVAYANQTYYKRGMGKSVHDSFELSFLPTDYKPLVLAMIGATSDGDLIQATEKLLKNTRSFLEEQTAQFAEKEPFETLFIGYYEELKSVINKMHRACDQEDTTTAFMIGAYFHEELSQFLNKVQTGIWFNDRHVYSAYSAPFEAIFKVDLMTLISSGDFTTLKAALKDFENTLVALLKKHQVEIAEFSSIEAFMEDYKGQ